MCVMQGLQDGSLSFHCVLSLHTKLSTMNQSSLAISASRSCFPHILYMSTTIFYCPVSPVSESLWEVCKAEIPSPVLGGPFGQIMHLGYPFLLSISSTVFSEEILFSLTPFFSSSFSFFHLPPPKRGPYTHQTSAFPLSYIPCLNLLFIISRTMIPLFSTDFLIYIFITEKQLEVIYFCLMQFFKLLEK